MEIKGNERDITDREWNRRQLTARARGSAMKRPVCQGQVLQGPDAKGQL